MPMHSKETAKKYWVIFLKKDKEGMQFTTFICVALTFQIINN